MRGARLRAMIVTLAGVAMLLAGGSSLRDVIAFPKTAAARALFEGAPTPVPPEGLRELHLRVTE